MKSGQSINPAEGLASGEEPFRPAGSTDGVNLPGAQRQLDARVSEEAQALTQNASIADSNGVISASMLQWVPSHQPGAYPGQTNSAQGHSLLNSLNIQRDEVQAEQ